MQIVNGLDGLRSLPPGAVASIGNFDGIHRGHARILQAARQFRDDGGASALVAITFEPHPLTVLRPAKAPQRLTSPVMKQALLEEQGVDWLVNLAPEPAVLGLTAERFWAILKDELHLAHLVEGASFRFGKGAAGNVTKLREWSAGSSLALHVAPSVSAVLLNLQIVDVTSSTIRFLLACGRARDAAICLGRPYRIEGLVVQGFHRGRQMGVPTANLQVDGQLIPVDGVYAGRCVVDGHTFPAAISIGDLPTFTENVRQIEAHLIGFKGDLYNQTIQLDLIDWLRDQQKFQNMAALKTRIESDIKYTALYADRDPARQIAK